MDLKALKEFINTRPYYIVKVIHVGESVFLIDNHDCVHSANGCYPVDVPCIEVPANHLKIKGEP